MGLAGEVRGWAGRQKAPATVFLLLSLIGAALFFWFFKGEHLDQVTFSSKWLTKPWSLVTYPWGEMPFGGGLSLMFFVFMLLWLYWMGTSVERELGTQKFLIYWVVMSALHALMLWGGALLMQVNFEWGGAWLPISAVTVAWCTRNPTQSIMLYGVLPISGKWLGLLTVVIVVLLVGNIAPLLGVFAAAPLGLAYLFAANRISFFPYSYSSMGLVKKDVTTGRGKIVSNEYFDEVRKREKDREERERLRKLFEGSISDEDK